jgi:hypothetical protein
MDVRSRVLLWRTGALLRRANHQRRATLKRELAAYSTPAELRSLLAAQRLRASHAQWSHVHRVS